MHDGMPLTDVGNRPAEIAADNSATSTFSRGSRATFVVAP